MILDFMVDVRPIEVGAAVRFEVMLASVIVGAAADAAARAVVSVVAASFAVSTDP